jgi:hypothetical protein
MELNFREENVDRFLEIIATAQKFKIYFNFSLSNTPGGYVSFIHDLGLDWLVGEDCHVGCSICIPLSKVLKTFESLEDIKNRIAGYTFVETKELGTSCQQLLKTAAERWDLTTDDVINAIKLSEVIASMENSTIKAQHIAEACQYVKPQ